MGPEFIQEFSCLTQTFQEWSTIPEAVDGWTVRNEAEDWRGNGRRVFSYHNVLSRDMVEVNGVFLPHKEMSAELAVLLE